MKTAGASMAPASTTTSTQKTKSLCEEVSNKTVSNTRSGIITDPPINSTDSQNQELTLPPKHSYPIQTNLASSFLTTNIPQPESTTMEIDPQTSIATDNVTIPQAQESPQTLPHAAPHQ